MVGILLRPEKGFGDLIKKDKYILILMFWTTQEVKQKPWETF